MARVADVMDCRKGTWDMEKLNNIFLPHEAKVILSIPISPSLPEDSLVWAWTNNRSFTVQSAYGVALQALKEGQQISDKGTNSDNSKMTNIWKSIWQLKCPNKIKHFLWRACKSILPTNHCLARRKIGTMVGCEFCGEKETSGHTLWNCLMATEEWKESGIKLPPRVSQQEEFINIVWLMKEYAREVD